MGEPLTAGQCFSSDGPNRAELKAGLGRANSCGPGRAATVLGRAGHFDRARLVDQNYNISF
jgi:hypothetical protein